MPGVRKGAQKGEDMNETAKGLLQYDIITTLIGVGILLIVAIIIACGKAFGKTITKMQERLWGTQEEEEDI